MLIYPAQNLNTLIKLCREHGILIIADEVMTGFGRTGSLFACDQLEEKPDILCVSKGLTGGFLPLGLTVCREEIFNAFLSKDLFKALLHGHSYTANPLACAAALASLDLTLSETCTIQRDQIADSHSHFCSKWKGHPRLKRCEWIGTILVIEYDLGQSTSYCHPIRDRLYYFFLEKGITVRPLGNVLYILPPYCITCDELQYIYDQISWSIENRI